MPGKCGKNEVLAFLDERKVPYDSLSHAAVFTMEEMDAAGISERGLILKNLFLRDSKGKRHFLISVPEEVRIDLRTVHELLGCTKVSFASAERLEKYLGVAQGSVSPLGILNDESKSVVVVFDSSLVGKTNIGVHPNDNTATVFLSFSDLRGIIEEHGNEVRLIDFSE